jgi:hypothetical protein
MVIVSPGRMLGPPDEREAILVEDPIERRYTVRKRACVAIKHASEPGLSPRTQTAARSACLAL